MIGIIGAMPIETDGIKARMKDTKIDSLAGLEFCHGMLEGVECVVAHCNPGKVNAALCTQLMILYKPALVINSGVAGGIGADVHIGDLTIASAVVQHDMDTSPLGDPKGLISGLNIIEIPANEKAASCIGQKAQGIYDGKVHTGVIATGDQFISDPARLHQLQADFSAIACEMEGGAVGHVCYSNNVPFVVLRAISDNADDDATMDYPRFAAMAADKGIQLLCSAIPELSQLF